jgi:hypothetical protein
VADFGFRLGVDKLSEPAASWPALPESGDEEGVGWLFAGAWLGEVPVSLAWAREVKTNAIPSNPAVSRTGALDTAESTSAPKILNFPPVTATSSSTPPNTNSPIAMLWGMGPPFLNSRFFLRGCTTDQAEMHVSQQEPGPVHTTPAGGAAGENRARQGGG